MATKEAPMPTRFHHPMPSQQLNAALDAAPQGQAVSVYHELLWDVLVRYAEGTRRVREYIVVEWPLPYGGAKPIRVTEPMATEKEAVAWVKLTATIWRMLKMQTPTWPWD